MTLPDVTGALIVSLGTVGDHPSLPRSVGYGSRWRGVLWRALLRQTERRSRASVPVPLANVLPDAAVIECQVRSGSSAAPCFTDADVAAIKGRDVDVLLHFGSWALTGEVLEVPRHGVWAIRYGEDRRRWDEPPGFWEMYYAEPVTGAVVVQLTEPPKPELLLHRGYFKTRMRSYWRHWDALRFGIGDWPARIFREIQGGVRPAPRHADDPPARRATVVPASRARQPTNLQVLNFGRRYATAALKRVRAALAVETWNIGVVRASIEQFVAAPQRYPVEWLPDPGPLRFRADPFWWPHSDRFRILAEEFDFRNRLGRIVALERSDEGWAATAQRGLAMEGHASYPFLVEDGGGVYCCPEAYRQGGVRLWRHMGDDEWVIHATLLEDVGAVDPTVFFFRDRWWLFASRQGRAGDEKLYGWHAPAVTGPWTPHLLNPLKTDARSSRPAGTPYVYAGRLFRPAQDGSGSYGAALVVQEVVRLSPTEFEEEPFTRVEPHEGSRYPHGMHTICAAGLWTLVDGKREVISPRELWWRWRRGLLTPAAAAIRGGR